MALEIERRYLLLPLRVEYFLKMFGMNFEKYEIVQSYLLRDGKLGRIRKLNDKYFLTIKKGEGLVREEYEDEITEDIYKNILNSSDDVKTLYKTRYVVNIDSYDYEFDEFEDKLKGLVLLEVEFKNEKEALNFNLNNSLKNVIVKEVTDDRRFDNSNLAISQTLPYL
ncbi:CHAD domain-containing protein [Hippea maritima]|uniref:CHAD domain-containing protein n=1 Tax=Hippea maritima (strain ATCC 700847 / DSM 10411 / MH2) TaxID=760142 RepID=F2LTM4_HIPMA|nr:CHAD domain-containing protein [Hippea maritima]AEA33349.1 CHAD domain-containing protein [Hippea maritima DSM 10411]